MPTLKRLTFLAAASVLATSPALAMPDRSEEVSATVQSEYAGDANAYVSANESDFRRMACKGRSDLLQALLDEGLDLRKIDYRTQSKAAMCAFWKNDLPTIKILFSPDFITAYELEHAGEASTGTLLWNAINSDDYGKVRHLLENGVHAFNYHNYWDPLTREEHLLLAAELALKHRKEDAIRAFDDAGFGQILSAARNEDNVTYVTYRPKGGKPAGGGGGGILRALVGGIAGAALGGPAGAAVGFYEGTGSGPKASETTTILPKSGPLPLETNRADLGLNLNSVAAPARGLRVIEVRPGGAAEAAGMMENDIVLSIAGEPVASRGSFYVATTKAAATPVFTVSFLRGGKLEDATFSPPPAPEPATFQSTQVPETGTHVSVNVGKLEKLEKLGNLRDRGIITEEEFEAMKADVLAE